MTQEDAARIFLILNSSWSAFDLKDKFKSLIFLLLKACNKLTKITLFYAPLNYAFFNLFLKSFFHSLKILQHPQKKDIYESETRYKFIDITSQWHLTSHFKFETHRDGIKCHDR